MSTLYSNEEEHIPLSFAPYVKAEDSNRIGRHFKTKEAVVFDSWYGSKETFDFLTSRGQTWITEAKTNRVIQWEDNRLQDDWLQIKQVFKKMPKKAHKRINTDIKDTRFKWYIELETVMKNVGKAKLVFLRKKKEQQNLHSTITNNTSLTTNQTIQYYKRRWDIEVFYRDCKQHLGMGEYQVRKLDAVVRHLHLVFLSYTILKGLACNPHPFSHILKGTKTIGTICQRLKLWTLNHLIKNPKPHPT